MNNTPLPACFFNGFCLWTFSGWKEKFLEEKLFGLQAKEKGINLSQSGAGNPKQSYVLSVFYAGISLLIFLAGSWPNPAHLMLHLRASETCERVIDFNGYWISSSFLGIAPLITYGLFMWVNWPQFGPTSVTFPALGKGRNPCHILLYGLSCPAGVKCTSLLREIWIWTILHW